MTVLSKPFLASYESKDFHLQSLDVEHCTGLEIATRAIFNATSEFTNPKTLERKVEEYTGTSISLDSFSFSERNACLACLVREVAANRGWLAGWHCLASAAPNCGLHQGLMRDVTACTEVYTRLRTRTETRSHIDVGMAVVSSPEVSSLTQIGPKGLGGRVWKTDKTYQELVATEWTSEGYGPMAPCSSFAWLSVIRAVVSAEDARACYAIQLLGTVDYDFDLDDVHKPGIRHSCKVAGLHAASVGKPIQGMAVAGLLNLDQQSFNREIQNGWVSQASGSVIPGPADISPADWVAMMIADCAIIGPFGYQTAFQYEQSRKGMWVGGILGNIHDVIYDVGCSSRISSVMYAAAAGATKHDIPQAYVTGMIDAIATRVLALSGKEIPLNGDSVILACFAWCSFNGRYRTWERFVKYTRLLQRSASEEASAILSKARQFLVLPVEDIDAEDIGKGWGDALATGSSRLAKRVTQSYTPGKISEVWKLDPGSLPTICAPCLIHFQASFYSEDDEVHAIPGIPAGVADSTAVRVAAAIRRTAVWATRSDCCDDCAGTIGVWVDSMAYKVFVALMQSHSFTPSREWLMQNYLCGCAELAPFSVTTILTGFDLVAELGFETGAMGGRDVVDC